MGKTYFKVRSVNKLGKNKFASANSPSLNTYKSIANLQKVTTCGALHKPCLNIEVKKKCFESRVGAGYLIIGNGLYKAVYGAHYWVVEFSQVGSTKYRFWDSISGLENK